MAQVSLITLYIGPSMHWIVFYFMQVFLYRIVDRLLPNQAPFKLDHFFLLNFLLIEISLARTRPNIYSLFLIEDSICILFLNWVYEADLIAFIYETLIQFFLIKILLDVLNTIFQVNFSIHFYCLQELIIKYLLIELFEWFLSQICFLNFICPQFLVPIFAIDFLYIILSMSQILALIIHTFNCTDFL